MRCRALSASIRSPHRPAGSPRKHRGAEEREHHLRDRLGRGPPRRRPVRRAGPDRGPATYRHRGRRLRRVAGAARRAQPRSRRRFRSRSRPTRTCWSSRLQHAGFEVYAINPRAVARYRERHGQAGQEVRPRRRRGAGRHPAHRPTPAPPAAADHRRPRWRSRRWPASTRRRSGRCTRRSADCGRCCWSSTRRPWSRSRTQAPRRAGRPGRGARPPTPDMRLTRRKIVSLLRGCGRRNDPALVEQIHRDLHTAGAAPARAGRGRTGRHRRRADRRSSPRCCAAVERSRKHLAATCSRSTRSRRCCARHPASGPSSLPACWPRSVTTLTGSPPRTACAPSPAPPRSPEPPVGPTTVKARKVRNKRLGDACHWWAFAALTKSAGRPRALRPPPSRRRRPQRRAAQPRPQAPRPALVVPAHRTALGRARPPGHSSFQTHLHRRCLTR